MLERRVSALARAAQRLAGDWRRLSSEQRRAALATALLALSLLLPWYAISYYNVDVAPGSPALSHDSRTGLEAFTFVEGLVLLLVAGVLALLFARSERRTFTLPGGDGGFVVGAGVWALLLLIYRMFDKPSISAGQGAVVTVGLDWGIFVALTGAAWLAYAGNRLRLADPSPAVGLAPTSNSAAERQHSRSGAAEPQPAAPQPPEPLPGETGRLF